MAAAPAATRRARRSTKDQPPSDTASPFMAGMAKMEGENGGGAAQDFLTRLKHPTAQDQQMYFHEQQQQQQHEQQGQHEQQAQQAQQAQHEQQSSQPFTAPAFINKLLKMINDPTFNDLISWNDKGTGFKVYDPPTFAKKVLPKYFKHSNFSSFVRQLNMYGFHKIVGVEHGALDNEDDSWEFSNTFFKRDQPHLLRFVKRKVNSSASDHEGSSANPSTAAGAAGAAAAGNGTLPRSSSRSFFAIAPATPSTSVPVTPLAGVYDSIGSLSPTSQLLHHQQLANAEEMKKLVGELQAIKSNQKVLKSRIGDMERNNQQIYNTMLAVRDRYDSQQKTIKKIMNFLASIYAPGQSIAGQRRFALGDAPLAVDASGNIFPMSDDDDDGGGGGGGVGIEPDFGGDLYDPGASSSSVVAIPSHFSSFLAAAAAAAAPSPSVAPSPAHQQRLSATPSSSSLAATASAPASAPPTPSPAAAAAAKYSSLSKSSSRASDAAGEGAGASMLIPFLSTGDGASSDHAATAPPGKGAKGRRSSTKKPSAFDGSDIQGKVTTGSPSSVTDGAAGNKSARKKAKEAEAGKTALSETSASSASTPKGFGGKKTAAVLESAPLNKSAAPAPPASSAFPSPASVALYVAAFPQLHATSATMAPATSAALSPTSAFNRVLFAAPPNQSLAESRADQDGAVHLAQVGSGEAFHSPLTWPSPPLSSSSAASFSSTAFPPRSGSTNGSTSTTTSSSSSSSSGGITGGGNNYASLSSSSLTHSPSADLAAANAPFQEAAASLFHNSQSVANDVDSLQKNIDHVTDTLFSGGYGFDDRTLETLITNTTPTSSDHPSEDGDDHSPTFDFLEHLTQLAESDTLPQNLPESFLNANQRHPHTFLDNAHVIAAAQAVDHAAGTEQGRGSSPSTSSSRASSTSDPSDYSQSRKALRYDPYVSGIMDLEDEDEHGDSRELGSAALPANASGASERASSTSASESKSNASSLTPPEESSGVFKTKRTASEALVDRQVA